MAASGSVNFDLNVSEVVPAGDGSGAASIAHALAKFSGLTSSKAFGGSSTPTWTDAWSDTVDLVAGAATIDLTALARQSPLEDVNFDTKKIVAFAFAGANANANGIEVSQGAAQPYPIFGTADDQVTVYPNQIVQVASLTQADLVAVANGTVDQIDFTGTGTEQIHVLLIAGA